MGLIEQTGARKLYLDANILIYALEAEPRYRDPLSEVLIAADNGEVALVTKVWILDDLVSNTAMR